ncbi:MAG: 5-formyltetrahydrofolate cyclo-ligase [Candidatus Delongbacteria bacterium]|nr:5-formyltetrahydrofolate cyclo-ligase [Candidatus Delongbacteria bacterium]
MKDEISSKKKTLRKQIKLIKRSLSSDDRAIHSNTVIRKLEESVEFKNSHTIFIYWAMDDEVDTREFIIKWYKKKTFILPTIDGDDLILKKFSGIDSLRDGDLYAIPEPKGEPFETLNDIDLAIIPGVAFDKQNNRMGRGKAYYDKILRKIKGRSILIGICFDFQLVDEVPVEEHDITMNKVIHS